MKKLVLVLVLVATLAIGIGVGFAATLGISSNHLWAGSQSLTKGTCTLSGTTQSTDTYVDEKSQKNSFGTGTTLQTRADTGNRRYALITFDVASCNLPSTAGADSATLSLEITSAPTAGRTLTVTPITSTWSNATTWNTMPTFSGTNTTTFTTGTTSNVAKTVSVTADVDDFIKGNLTNWGWRIADLTSTSTNYTTQIASSDAASNKPTLTIDYEK